MGGIHNRADLVLLVVELVDHQRTVAVADEVMNDVGHGGEQQRLVVAGDEVDSHAGSDWHIVGRVAPVMTRRQCADPGNDGHPSNC